MGVKRLLEILAPGAQPVTARELRVALDEVRKEATGLAARLEGLQSDRRAALLVGDDRQVDAIETQMAMVQRSADRLDVQLPELERRHKDQVAREKAATDREAFDGAVQQRIGAARDLDRAFAEIGKAFASYKNAGLALGGLQDLHRAKYFGQASLEEGGIERDTFANILYRRSPDLAKALGLLDPGEYGFDKSSTIESAEAQFWSALGGRAASSTELKGV